MGRITKRASITRVRVGERPTTRTDSLAVEEPLEIRVAGTRLAVTMRTPGHDVELAAGFLVSEGIIARGADFRRAIHCGGPGTGNGSGGSEENTYNILDTALAAHVPPLDPTITRSVLTTSACGLCGKAALEQVEINSQYAVADDPVRVPAEVIARLPDTLRAQQEVFEKTGGLHAAGLFDAEGKLLVLREDVGRHNAVDKVIGWGLLQDQLPLVGTILMVSGRASFELAQKAVLAGIPILAAVSAPSSLAVDLAKRTGLTLIGFLRGPAMNVYHRPDRVLTEVPALAT